MEYFRHDGHLTDTALTALVRNDPLEELTRLEIAEHLAFCDQCLQRYTQLLSGDKLLMPEESCRTSLLNRIRQRAIRLIASRYATAAAAVALALTLLWGGLDFPGSSASPPLQDPDPSPTLSQQFSSWSARWNDAMDAIMGQLNHLWH